jgi:hypothetical protein
MDLVKFAAQLKGDDEKSPPYALRASDLDANFAFLHLKKPDGNNAPYEILRSTDDGFTLQGARIFDVCENGSAVKYRIFASRVAT